MFSRGLYMDSVIFVSGVYGVGKSTLCDKLSEKLRIPAFSAGDLISEINGEKYGKNKNVIDAKYNQDVLVSAVEEKLRTLPQFILAGHFCIIDKSFEVELLPEIVFSKLHLQQIVLLEADVLRIQENISNRDQKVYPVYTLEKLILAEREQAKKIAKELKIPLTMHSMYFNHLDEKILAEALRGGCDNESAFRY